MSRRWLMRSCGVHRVMMLLECCYSQACITKMARAYFAVHCDSNVVPAHSAAEHRSYILGGDLGSIGGCGGLGECGGGNGDGGRDGGGGGAGTSAFETNPRNRWKNFSL